MAASKPNTPTATSRRLKYGLNVAVTVVVAIAIAVLINALAYKSYLRQDFTAMGRYSLSKQTRQVLRSLDKPYTIATLMTQAQPGSGSLRGEAVQQTMDLVDVYDRFSDQIEAQHLGGRDIARMEKFFASLEARYADRLEPVRAAIQTGRAALRNLKGEVGRQMELLKAILGDETFRDARLLEYTNTLAANLGQFDQRVEQIDEQIGQILDQPMPDLEAARGLVRDWLTERKDNVYARAITIFDDAVKRPETPAAVKDLMLQSVTLFKRSIEAIDDAVAKLDAAEPVGDYQELRRKLDDVTQPDKIIITGNQRVQVIPLADMLQDVRAPQADDSQPQLQFLGEERITGALMSMGMENPPMVVFVSNAPVPAAGPAPPQMRPEMIQFRYEHVANRLRSANIDVQVWNPAGQMASFGQMMPPGPPPEPKPGQRAVWVMLPFTPENPMSPTGGHSAQQAVEHVRQRLEAGDGALFVLGPDLGPRFGAPDPVGELLGPWGITPQTDRIIFHERVAPNRRNVPDPQFLIEQWPRDLVVTEALAGLRGLIYNGSPLVLGSGEKEGVTRYPLIRLQAPRMWAEDDLDFDPPPTFDPEAAAESFIVGVAAEADDQRLVVIADPIWASDFVTTMSTVGGRGEEAINIFGAAVPANAELFINSVYWLAGLEELIAASPRTQDVRRVAPISAAADSAIRWGLLLGTPALAFGAGIGMWLVRRRA